MPPYTSPRNLRDLLRAEPRLEPTRVARLLGEVAAALAPRHARGEAHGALTPERVLLDADGRASVAPPPADEGAALAPWPAYLAPEQIDGRPPEPHSDVYALGLLGWEMLAGQPPWAGESLYNVVLKQRQQDLPRLSTMRPGLPRAVVHAIEGALHKSPGDRWRDAGEMLAELGLDGHPVAALYDGPAAAMAPPAVQAHVDDDPLDRASPHARPVVSAPILPAEPAPSGTRAAPPARATRSKARPLTLAALALAVLGAGAAGLAVVQGREEKGSTQAWLDSISAGGATGEVIAESTLTVAEEMARDRARRDSLARRNRAAAAQAQRDSLQAAAAAESAAAQGSGDTAAPRDTAAPPPPPDTMPAPPSTRPATPAPVPNPSPAPPLPPGTTPSETPSTSPTP